MKNCFFIINDITKLDNPVYLINSLNFIRYIFYFSKKCNNFDKKRQSFVYFVPRSR